MTKLQRLRYLMLPLLVWALFSRPLQSDEGWVSALQNEVKKLDAATPGKFGVYIKRVDDGEVLSYEGERSWYLSSTTKVPVAIAILQKQERGELLLQKKLRLEKKNYVDGGGDLLWQEPGGKFTIETLLEKMLLQSDSTATDLLIAELGEDELNRQVREKMVEGFGPLTSLLQVRYDAFSEMHPSARNLSNMDFIELKRFKTPEARINELITRMGVRRDELLAPTIEEAFERYYSRALNTSSLKTYAKLLERLVQGELLSPSNTEKVLGWMEKMTTGEKRIQAGLPQGVRFAQKTGTQLHRMCNVGVIRKGAQVTQDIVIAACLEKFPDPEKAEAVFEEFGRALVRSGVLKTERPAAPE